MSAISHFMNSQGPDPDLENLLVRMRRRLYPETTDVLASYWLKTVYQRGPGRSWWKHLDKQLSDALGEAGWNEYARSALLGIQDWVRGTALHSGKAPDAAPPRKEPSRANLKQEWAAPYLCRVLNEWLAGEIARTQLNEAPGGDGGIAPLTIARCIERLVAREHLSPANLEMLLQPELLSAKYVYPAHAEMLIDIVMDLLGRTDAPAFPVTPCALLTVMSHSSLPPDYSEAVQRATLYTRPEGERIEVPLTPAQAVEVLHGGAVRMASTIASADGRWWQSERLDTGEPSSLVYRPAGRLRIEYAADHTRLDAPWPEKQGEWSGAVDFKGPLQLFGREWRGASWEMGEDGARMHFVFSQMLPVAEVQPAQDAAVRRSRPAYVDMAWSALENALAAAMAAHSRDPIEQLRRGDFIPLGRAIFQLAEAIESHGASREMLETQLRAIRYQQAGIALEYGSAPWRVLPQAVQSYLLKQRRDAAVMELIVQTFEGLPEGTPGTHRHGPSPQAA